MFLNPYCFTQTVDGYWYGNANVKVNSSANNYLVELILTQKGNNITGVLNYYFKNTFRTLPIRGTFNPHTRLVFIKEIPVSYYGSFMNMDVDCIMDFVATLRVAKVGSSLHGSFESLPKYKYTCPRIDFNLKLSKDAHNQDSLLYAIRTLKETFQVWTPDEADTLVAVKIQPRKVINYVVSNQFKERENELANEIIVDADTVQVDFYDNGEIDGDSISVFLNEQLIAFSQKLSTKAIHFDIPLDMSREYNEIIMFADNLGAIPPNTALMVVNDGKRKYEVRSENRPFLYCRRRTRREGSCSSERN
ncbi:MAG: deoxyhypusine synthase family protein [Bacteroidia bacterium]|nr:deoxyhypusine synthase family protein [Bacteroidia bacterium]